MKPLLLALVLAVTGCGGWQLNLQKGISTVALSASGCGTVLDKANDAKQLAIRELAKTDANGAQVVLTGWAQTRSKIFLGCEVANLLAVEAKRLAPAMTSKDAALWIGKLLAAAADVVKLLNEHGLKLPGGL